MNIIELGALGEFVGAIAVVVTLIYLTIQLKQNTGIQKLASVQQVLGTSASLNALMATDEQLVELIGIVAQDKDLTPIQATRFSSLMFATFASHWQVHYQHTLGYLDREIFDTYERRTAYLMRSRHSLDWWQANKFRFSNTYQDYVDGLVSDDA